QLSVRLDRSLLSATAPADEATEAIDAMLRTIFDAARDDVGRALRAGAIRMDDDAEPAPGILRQDLNRMSRARAAELRDRLTALLDDFDLGRHDDPDGAPFGLLVALYPVPQTRLEET